MMDWLDSLQQNVTRGEPCVLVTVTNARGSTPRDVGAKMVVTREKTAGSIGGGQLEYQSIELARQRLADARKTRPASFSRTFALGAGCGQCCGGVAEILFEHIEESNAEWISLLGEFIKRDEPIVLLTATAPEGGNKLLVTANVVQSAYAERPLPDRAVNIARHFLTNDLPAQKKTLNVSGNVKVSLFFEPIRPVRFNIFLFGAGHVGSVLTRVLAELPCNVTWIDSRPTLLTGEMPANVKPIVNETPYMEVGRAPAGTYFVVMTHSHPLDQEICNRVLQRGDFAYCGLIGSRSKRRRFEKQFRALGIPESSIEALTCPIGVRDITGKRPGEIAVAVAAELLALHERAVASGLTRSPLRTA